jgi:hypothetical protein
MLTAFLVRPAHFRMLVPKLAASKDSAPFLRLPEPAVENRQRDNAFCSGRKMSSRGRRMG